MKRYLKKHIISVVTIASAIIIDVVINILSFLSIGDINISTFENLIYGTIILFISTNLIEYNTILDSIDTSIKCVEKKNGTSLVKNFFTVEKCADYVKMIIEQGEHKIDYVSLDKKTRSSNLKSRQRMMKVLEKFVSSPSIQCRYLSIMDQKNFNIFSQLMNKSLLEQRNTYYAYYKPVNISFASFYIIDDKFLVIRSPYDNGTDKHYYCVIEEVEICSLYKQWYDLLWKESIKIDSLSKFKELEEEFLDNVDLKMVKICKQIEDKYNEYAQKM